MQSSHSHTPKIIGALAIAVVVGVGGFLVINGASAQQISRVTTTSSSSSQPIAPSVVPSAPAAPVSEQPSSGLVYKNGTYDAKASYRVPGSQNSISVTLTVTSDTITAVETSSSYVDTESKPYLDSFESGISSAIVGRSLTDAYDGRIGGASLTTGAFDDALQTIMNNAKA